MSTLLDAQLAARRAEVNAVLRAKRTSSNVDVNVAASKKDEVVASLKRAGILTRTGRLKTVKISR